MADSEHDIVIRISAKDLTEMAAKSARGNVAGVGDETEKAAQKAAGAAAVFQERWAAAAAATGAAIVGIRQAASALSDLLSASSEQEDALVRVNAALQAQGTFTPQLAAQYAELASQFQRTTIFGDELISEMQGLLIQIGGVMPDQMEGALTAATNLAAGLRIDLRTATQLVGKAFAGETGTLKRYGIVIDEAKLKAGGATAVLEAINEKMGGQAQAQAATYSGQMKQLANQYGDVKEEAGAMLAQAILPVLTAFTSLSPTTQLVISAAVILAGVLGPVALGIGGVVTALTLMMPVLSVALPAALATVSGLLLPGAALLAGIAGVVAIWKNWDTIGPIVEGVYTSVKTWLIDKFELFKQNWQVLLGPAGVLFVLWKNFGPQITALAQAVYTGVKMWLVDKFAAIVQGVRDKIAAVTGFFKNMKDAVVGNSYVPDMINGIATEFGRLDSVMVQPTERATTKTSGLFRTLTSEIGDSISSINPKLGSFLSAGQQAASGWARVFAGDLSGLSDALTGTWNVIKSIGPGIKNFFVNLFGGPSAKEKEGRTIAGQFRDDLAETLTEAQKLEVQTAKNAGQNERWASTVIVLRDRYLALGLTEEEALRDADRLWRAEQEGGEAVARVIEDINGKTKALGETTETTGATAVVSFQQAKDQLDLVKDEAIGSENHGLIQAVFALEEQMRIAAENGETDFTVMAARIGELKKEIASGITIPIGFTLGGVPFQAIEKTAKGASEQAQFAGMSESAQRERAERFLRENQKDVHRLTSALGITPERARELGFQHGTPDLDFLPFGRGMFARMHGDEAVIPRGSGHQLAAEIAAAMGGAGRERIEIRVVTQLDGRVLAEELVPVLPGALKRRGFRL